MVAYIRVNKVDLEQNNPLWVRPKKEFLAKFVPVKLKEE